jgi:L-seryl-tRNA(Ser) seleniumtransferase
MGCEGGSGDMTMKADGRNDAEQELYRALPSVSEVLLREPAQSLLLKYPHKTVVDCIRVALDELRREIASGMSTHEAIASGVEALPQKIETILRRQQRPSLQRVINATGVLLHTNLGRAPLSRKAIEHIGNVAREYSNLEFDLNLGERGKRDMHVERLLLLIVAESAGIAAPQETHRAVVVNNCAAATFLALHALAKGKEVLVSRGELVEIGGGFRVPEILAESGAVLCEVGTTNRTRVADYEAALSSETAMILRVHQSNFSMEGFVHRPMLSDLVALGRRAQVPVFEDQGTGLLHPLAPYGIAGEPTLIECVAAGCDLVAASGDKLLGGPQCGLLIGRKDLIERIRANPLFRALRVDKLTYAALEATLLQYQAGTLDEIPLFRMLAAPSEQIRERCARLAAPLANSALTAEVVALEGMLGGGTSPRTRVKSFGLSLHHTALSAADMLRALRGQNPPVIGRIEGDRVLLDLRTVDPASDGELAQALDKVTKFDSLADETAGE